MSARSRLVVEESRLALRLFGLPFAAAGLFVMSVPLHQELQGPWWTLLLFGLPFAAVGLAFIGWRDRTTIDLESRTVTSWSGLFVPMKSRTQSLDRLRAVTICHETRRTKNGSYSVYPVRLGGLAHEITLEVPRDHQRARATAERFAKALGVGIEDTSSGVRIVRDADMLDASLRDQARAAGVRHEAPPQPADSKVRVGSDPDGLALDLPARSSFLDYIPMVIGGGVFLFGASSLSGSLLDADAFDLVFSVFFAGVPMAIGLVFVFRGIRDATTRERIVVSPDVLRVERRSVFGVRIQKMSADEVEELVNTGAPFRRALAETAGGLDGRQRAQVERNLARFGLLRHGHLVARSDDASIEFAAGLEPDDLAWVAETVRSMLTA